MALVKITKADFDTAIKTLTTSDATVWWKKLETTDDGTELCFVVGWADGFDPDENLYQQDGYTLCSKIGYKHSDLMVMDYSDFYMPYDKKSGNVWDTDMSVGKGGPSKFDVDWYNDEANSIWSKYGKPNRDGLTALDLMESKKSEAKKPGAKKSEAKKHTCSMAKKIESLKKKPAKKSESISASSIRVDPYDVAVKVQEVNEYPSTNGYTLTAEVPAVEAWFNDLSEFKDCVVGLAENCNGYPTISRDGSDILVQIHAPIDDENGEFTGDYEVIVELRCSTEITHSSLDGVVDVLNGDA